MQIIFFIIFKDLIFLLLVGESSDWFTNRTNKKGGHTNDS